MEPWKQRYVWYFWNETMYLKYGHQWAWYSSTDDIWALRTTVEWFLLRKTEKPAPVPLYQKFHMEWCGRKLISLWWEASDWAMLQPCALSVLILCNRKPCHFYIVNCYIADWSVIVWYVWSVQFQLWIRHLATVYNSDPCSVTVNVWRPVS